MLDRLGSRFEVGYEKKNSSILEGLPT